MNRHPRIPLLLFFLTLFLLCTTYAKEPSPAPTTGIILRNTDTGPVLERVLCGEEAHTDGAFHFFHPDRRTLCLHDTVPYPGQALLPIEKSAASVTLPPPWRLVEGSDRLLIYDGAASFPPNTDETGRVLTTPAEDLYLDPQGRLATPRFILRGETWEPVLPLRELYRLTVENDGRFTLTVTTAADLDEAARDPARFFGIAATALTVRERTSNGLRLEGSGLDTAAIPRLHLRPGGDLYGRYRIEVSAGGHRFSKGQTQKRPLFNARIQTAPDGTLLVEVRIESARLSDEDRAMLDAFLKKELPHRYTVKK